MKDFPVRNAPTTDTIARGMSAGACKDRGERMRGEKIGGVKRGEAGREKGREKGETRRGG